MAMMPQAKFCAYNAFFLNEYPAACCGWDGQETDLRKTAYLYLDD